MNFDGVEKVIGLISTIGTFMVCRFNWLINVNKSRKIKIVEDIIFDFHSNLMEFSELEEAVKQKTKRKYSKRELFQILHNLNCKGKIRNETTDGAYMYQLFYILERF